MEKLIEINGLFYERKPQKERKGSMMEATAVALAVAFGGARVLSTLKDRQKFSEVRISDIIEEFKLIQNKKSKLSKSERDSVEYQFHKHFSLVKEPNNP